MGWAILAVGIGLILWTVLTIDNWSRDFTTNFATTDASTGRADVPPLESDATPFELASAVRQWVDTTSRWTIVSEETAGGEARFHLTRTTPLMRFTDDIHVRIATDPTDGRTVLHADSQSRVGKGDLGQNPRNLKELIAGVRAESPATGPTE